MARKSLLTVLPTGDGKSICYQLPALAHYVHSAIARLVPGAPIEVRERGLYSRDGVLVGRLARSMDLSGVRIREAKVHSILVRQRAQVADPRFSAQLKVDRWETVLCELWLESEGTP